VTARQPAHDDGRQIQHQPAPLPGGLRSRAGQVEDILRSLDITEPGMLLRAAAIDEAARDVLANAAASSRKRDTINQPPQRNQGHQTGPRERQQKTSYTPAQMRRYTSYLRALLAA